MGYEDNMPTSALSTGSPLEVSPESRTRDSADHAGPSPPLVLLRVPTSSRVEPSSPSLSNSSSIATILALMDATVAPWPVPSFGTSPTRLISSLTTHTLLLTEPATPATILVSPLMLVTLWSPRAPALL